MRPDPLGKDARTAATQAAMGVEVIPPTQPVTPRQIEYPTDWPQHAPVPQITAKAHLAKGTEKMIGGVHVIIMPDPRLPLVNWTLTTRHGSFEDPKGKEGLSSLGDAMLRRGAANLSYAELAEELESKGISIEVSDGGDTTTVAGSCITQQLDTALLRTRQLCDEPTFPTSEFAKLKDQTLSELQLSQENPTTVAGEDLNAALWGDTPLGRHATPASVESITLDEIKAAYARNFAHDGAILVLSGDVTEDHGFELAETLLKSKSSVEVAAAPGLHLSGNAPAKRRIIVVDRPSGRQSSVRIAIPAYDILSEDKFAGSVAGQILSGGGIDSRLMRYVRAEKGLAYGVHGVFQPGRHGGAFVAGTETAVESTADAIEAIFKVLTDMKSADVAPDELAEAKTARGRRVAHGDADHRPAGDLSRRWHPQRLPHRLLRQLSCPLGRNHRRAGSRRHEQICG